MHHISKSAIVPYSSEKMFNLVNDIANYPLFLNWCCASEIISQTDDEIIASVTVNQSVFKQSFTTINTLEKDKKIYMKLKEGPFKELLGTWVFTQFDENASKVELDLSFSFSNKLVDLSLSPIFSHIASSQLDAFVQRARQVYG
jgi:ribosome-associated toxin RatA of RatAB toxin-antitoxin module